MDVGKLFSMRALLIAYSALISASCFADINPVSQEVLHYVSKNILEATSKYEERNGYCSNLVESNDLPKFDSKKLASLNATREDSLIAVAFLSFNKYFNCVRDARLELAFQLGTMEHLKMELNIDSSSIKEVQSVISYPSNKELELKVKYLKLLPAKRNYYESKVGGGPFDLMKTLEINGLIRE